MRAAIVISLAIHIALSFVAFRLVRISQVRFVPREVYAVRLVSLQEAGGGPQREEMKAPPKESPKEPPAPVEEKKPDEMVAPAKQPKAKPKEPAGKTVPSTRVEKPASPTIDSGGDGTEVGPVTTGDMALDVADFPFAYYLATVKRKIAANWQVPGTGGTSTFCRVYFRITNSGQIDSPAVETSSGNFMFDQAALRAVVEANPLPALPGGFTDSYLGVHFSFAYEEE